MVSPHQLFRFVQRDPDPDLLVITNMWPEQHRPAYGTFVERQVQALRASGLHCDVLYIRGYLSKVAYVLSVPIFAWLTVFARGRYRLTHVHAGETALAARFYMSRRMIVTYHGDDMLGYRADEGPISVRSRIRSFIVRTHSCLFAATVTQSNEMHQRLPRVTRRRNSIIPCGVDTTRFYPMDREEARSQLGWGRSDQVVLFAATRPHEPRKRLDLARAAVTCAEAAVGPIRLVIAENLPPETIPVMMNAADCLLLTSMAEGSPVVVKEALMCNLPVVATDIADVKAMLNGVSPSAVCQHEPAEIGAALANILAERQRSNGRAQHADLDQSTTIHRLLRVYSDLGVRPRPHLASSASVSS